MLTPLQKEIMRFLANNSGREYTHREIAKQLNRQSNSIWFELADLDNTIYYGRKWVNYCAARRCGVSHRDITTWRIHRPVGKRV